MRSPARFTCQPRHCRCQIDLVRHPHQPTAIPTADTPLLVTPEWLQAHLDDPLVRILDCTTWMAPQPMVVTRAWWVLTALGHPRVSVLDGGLPRWRHEGRQPPDAIHARLAAAGWATRPRR